MSYDFFGTATPAAALSVPMAAPPLPRPAPRRRWPYLLAAVVVLAGGGFMVQSRRTPAPGPPLTSPDTIAGYRRLGTPPVPGAQELQQKTKAAGIVQEIQAQYAAPDGHPPKFTLYAYRKPAYSRRKPADALADAFRDDAKHPDWFGPKTPFPAGPHGGVLECKTLKSLAAFCVWADGEIIGNVFSMTTDLEALAALTLEIRDAVQPPG